MCMEELIINISGCISGILPLLQFDNLLGGYCLNPEPFLALNPGNLWLSMCVIKSCTLRKLVQQREIWQAPP